MKVRILFCAVALVCLFAGKSFATLTATNTLTNVVVNGSSYSFDIYSERTSAGTNFASQVHVGITSYVFDVDQTGGFDFTTAPVLSNVNANYSSADGTSNDYGPMTAQWVTVGARKKSNGNKLTSLEMLLAMDSLFLLPRLTVSKCAQLHLPLLMPLTLRAWLGIKSTVEFRPQTLHQLPIVMQGPIILLFPSRSPRSPL